MNRTTAEEIAEAAARKAVVEYAREREKENKKKVFQNTRILMKNYKSIKEHVENAITEAADMEMDIEDDGVDKEELFIKSIKRSKIRSLIMISHIESCLRLLEKEERNKNTFEKYLAYTYYYIDEMEAESIGEIVGCDARTIRRWINECDRKMSIYLFGADALRIFL